MRWNRCGYLGALSAAQGETLCHSIDGVLFQLFAEYIKISRSKPKRRYSSKKWL